MLLEQQKGEWEMFLKKRVIAFLMAAISMVTLFFGATTVDAARMDMVDVSNYNGDMTVANFQDMINNYGVKAMVTKISEGTSFKDSVAANNIKTAQAAGLYVNGYHYARYSTVSGAIAEADYSAKLAKEDGLPTGAVLATDVESSEQSSLSKSQNDANNQAFMNEVAKYGYRSTIYTMGSWVDTVMTVSSGWIASYPSNATDLQWYSADHGWQWSSTYQFDGSYGNFDVSQLYDDFFTTYQTPTGYTDSSTTTNAGSTSSTTTDTSTSTSNDSVITVNNTSSNYVPLVAINNGSVSTVSNRALSNGSAWKTDKTQVIDNVTYYRVATNEWVNAEYIKGNNATTSSASDSTGSTSNSVVKVRNSDGSYVRLMALQTDGSMQPVDNRALGNDTSWLTDQSKVVDGVTYYRVATNEWVAQTYVIS